MTVDVTTSFTGGNSVGKPSENFEIDSGGGERDDASDSSFDHTKYIWLHAFYHSLVATIGTGILGFPYAASHFGYAGSVILITAVSAYCYYTAILLVGLQEKDQGTYSEVCEGVMGARFARWTVRPLQYLNFFPVNAVMILVGGMAFAEMDSLLYNGGGGNGGDFGSESGALSLKTWTLIDAALVLLLSLLPDLNRAWQVSVMGAFAAFLITGYCVVGSLIAVADSDVPPSDAVVADKSEGSGYVFAVMAAFGDILFGYGFHAILPDIQASLHDHNTKDSKADMKKAVKASFGFAYLAYMLVALAGYGAFGASVDSTILQNLGDVLSKSSMVVVLVFVVIKTATEAAVYNQAAFTLTRDIFGLTLDSDHVDHHPRNWKIDVAIRFVWVVLGAMVAIYIPFFSDLTAITAAISMTPLTCLLPVIMWNRKAGETAPKWRLWLHYVLMFLATVMAVVALIGACAEIAIAL